MKDKLELSDLQPFPMGKDGLKFRSLITNEDETIDYIDFKYGHVGTHNERLPYSEDNAMCHNVSEIKPYLRSLDQLTHEITHGGKTFVPFIELLRACNFDVDNMSEEDLNHYKPNEEDLNHHMMQTKMHCEVVKLYEWHFNVGGLPPSLFIELKEETK